MQSLMVAALWSSSDESNEQGGDPLDKNYDIGDIDRATYGRMIRDCRAFQKVRAPLKKYQS